jgi:hypothetical protein
MLGRRCVGFDTYVLEQNTTTRSCTLHDTIKRLDFTILNGCFYSPYELRASIVNLSLFNSMRHTLVCE